MSDNKTLDRCELAADVADKDPIQYYKANRHLKRTDKLCPRCGARSVDKTYRRCNNCNGRLIWDGDDATYFNETMTEWYIWHTDIYGITGWFSKDYWRANYHIQNKF